MASACTKQNRQKRSPSGKTQMARSNANKARRAARRQRQRKAAAEAKAPRFTPIVQIGREGENWTSTPEFLGGGDFTKKSKIVRALRAHGIPDRRIALRA